ncbi:MAG: hypothetical protein ACI87O_002829 [Planctomycetota bacterium]|jgi:hypothetical protein
MKLTMTTGLVAVALALPLIAANFAQESNISEGSTPSYTFREAPTNAMGVKSLEAMRGKPVLVEFWGTK